MLEGAVFLDCGSDLGSGRHVPGQSSLEQLHLDYLKPFNVLLRHNNALFAPVLSNFLRSPPVL